MKFKNFRQKLMLLILLWIGLACLQNEAEATLGFSVIDGPVYDFGEVQQNEIVTHTFEIVNTGSSDLVIGETRSDCDCTVAEIEPRRIPPRGSANVTLTFNTRYRSGFQERKVEFEINRQVDTWPHVVLQGYVHALVEVIPYNLDFGVVSVDTVISKTVEIVNHSRYPLILEAFEPPYEFISCEAVRDTIPAGQSTDLTVRLTHPTAGYFNEPIVVRTNLKRYPKFTIELVGYATAENTD